MVKHYSHEDIVLLEVHQIDEETHDITLVEFDMNWNYLEFESKSVKSETFIDSNELLPNFISNEMNDQKKNEMVSTYKRLITGVCDNQCLKQKSNKVFVQNQDSSPKWKLRIKLGIN